MNDTVVLGDRITSDEYHRRVAAELTFLPPGERDEILSEVEEHLADVAREGGDLLGRLGTPEAYARELVTAAGLEASHGRSQSWWRSAAEHLQSQRHARELISFVRTLRPAWWVLRGFLAVVALAVLMDPDVEWWGPLWPMPLLGGFDYPVSLCLVLVAIPASVGLGRRVFGTVGRAVVVVANVAVVTLSGMALLDVGDRVSSPPSSGHYVPTSGLRQDGSPIRNIIVFDAAGKPLSDVRLFDQHGDPITTKPSGVPRRFIQYPNDEYGVEYRNAFPLVIVNRNGDSDLRWSLPRMLTIPPLADQKQPESSGDDRPAGQGQPGRNSDR